MLVRERYVPRPVGPRDVGEAQRSMYALRRDGTLAVNTWPPITGWYEKPWMVPDDNGPRARRWIPIWIYQSIAKDPETGEACDRSPQWLCQIDGRESRLEFAWPECAGRPITERAYFELLQQRDADDGYDPDATDY